MAREPPLPQPQAPPARMVAVRLGASHADDWEPVAAALEQFTPLAEALRPGLHAFGARGPSRYFGGERALAELVAKAVALPSASRAGVGVADGLFAAGLAAEAAAASTDVLVIPPQQSQPFLDDLPLISLRDPVSPLHGDEDGAEALLDVLWRLGMRTLGDLAALSEADMLGRFGWPGLLAHRLACGLDDRPLQAEAAGDSASVEAEIDPPADRVETVAFTARALADDMMARLDRDGLDCVSIGIEAESDSGHASSRRWRHERRFAAADVVDRVRWQLEGWYRSPNRPTGPVTLIRITPWVTAPADGRQLGMWGATSMADERAARALARVQGLWSAEAVTVPRLAGGRRPADTGRRVPLHAAANADRGQDSSATGPRNGRKNRKAKAKAVDAPWLGRLPAPSPAVVLAQPEPITVTDCGGAPVTVGGRGEASAPPWQMTDSAGHSRTVVAWAGPWPLDERWWRPSVRRRQARFQMVLDDDSAHLCVLESNRWWREATYD
ncbi:MAG: hypothetical protein OXG66_13460 [Acidimicrobiaceae bacterium]|nr:hypothetical protein [Acidimicrobiaceae bacterium]